MPHKSLPLPLQSTVLAPQLLTEVCALDHGERGKHVDVQIVEIHPLISLRHQLECVSQQLLLREALLKKMAPRDHRVTLHRFYFLACGFSVCKLLPFFFPALFCFVFFIQTVGSKSIQTPLIYSHPVTLQPQTSVYFR